MNDEKEATTPKRMDLKEFREKGFLQEANRLFFHPLGLALEIIVDDDDPSKVKSLGGIWDYRDDPEGMLYGEGIGRQEKMDHVKNLRESKIEARSKIEGVNEEGIQQI